MVTEAVGRRTRRSLSLFMCLANGLHQWDGASCYGTSVADRHADTRKAVVDDINDGLAVGEGMLNERRDRLVCPTPVSRVESRPAIRRDLPVGVPAGGGNDSVGGQFAMATLYPPRCMVMRFFCHDCINPF